MSYDTFRNGFWNPSTLTVAVNKGIHFVSKKMLSIFKDIIFIKKRS